MVTARRCPVCKSANVEIVDEEGIEFLKCKQCGFDETEEFDAAYPDAKAAGGKGTPYKRGGSQRTVKR